MKKRGRPKAICQRGHKIKGDNAILVGNSLRCRECRKIRDRNSYWGIKKPPAVIDGKRRCTACRKKKDAGEFYARGGGQKGGPRKTEAVCKICKYQKDRMRLEKESVKVRRAFLQKQRRQKDPASHAKAAKEHRVKLRNEVITAYGGVCVCCGEDNREFLAIDHINGGGTKSRKLGLHIAGTSFYLWLRKLDFPKDLFRLLCHNCNMSRGCYGYCPHESAVEKLLESVSGLEVQLLPHA